jgi:copper chaperone
MKKLIVLLAAAVLFACNSQPRTETQEDPADNNAEWVVVKLKVEGMTCDGCENAIKAGVESLDGIAEVESSHEEAWTRVRYDKSVTSLEEIEEKITETGYTVVGEL